MSFHFGAFCFDVRQFGAFQFGAFHFDAVPVRRVSLWRASTSARFTLARFHFGAFHFGAFPNFVRTYGDPVPANASFARNICVHVSIQIRSLSGDTKADHIPFRAALVETNRYRHYQLASSKAMSTKTKRRPVCLKQCQL